MPVLPCRLRNRLRDVLCSSGILRRHVQSDKSDESVRTETLKYGPMLSIVGKEHSLPNTVRHLIKENEQ